MAEEYYYREWRIRADMVAALERYVEHGVPLGHFLQSIVGNDFKEACARGDTDNLNNLPAFAVYLYNEMPIGCHGSYEKYHEWLKNFNFI